MRTPCSSPTARAAAPAWAEAAVAAAGHRCRPSSRPPTAPWVPTTLFGIGVLRYMKRYGMTHEQLAAVAVVQREWASRNPRASYRDPITVDDVLGSRMIAYPFHLLECCLVTDGGGALILVRAERARDFPNKPVYVLGSGESVEAPMISQMKDVTSSQAFRIAGGEAMRSAGISHADVDHLMVYDAFAHLPIWGLEDLGFCERGEAPGFIEDGNTRPGGKLPLNTNGGGLSYMHSGMYGMYALQESVRQMRGTAPAQVPGAKISVCLGVGGMFAASGCIVLATVRRERAAKDRRRLPRRNRTGCVGRANDWGWPH